MTGNLDNPYMRRRDTLDSVNIFKSNTVNDLVYDTAMQTCPSETDRFHKEAVADALQFIRGNFTRQITIAEIAASVYMSTYHFCRIFKKYTGCAPYQYLLEARLEYAALLLAYPEKKITQICYLSGFRRIAHFSAMFTKRYGISPTAFRCRQKAAPATEEENNVTSTSVKLLLVR